MHDGTPNGHVPSAHYLQQVKDEDNHVDIAPSATPVENALNGDHKSEDRDTPPAKRRKLAAPNDSIKLPRPVSPPWKRSGAEGPTSFTVDGRRKSGRTNAVPLELQPQAAKRTTRAAFDKVVGDQKLHKPSYTLSQKRPQPPQPPSKPTSTAAKRVNTPQTKKTDHASPAQSKSRDRSRSKSAVMPSNASRLAQLEAELALLKKVKRSKVNGYVTQESDESEAESSEPPSPVQVPLAPLKVRKVNFRVKLSSPTIATPANRPPDKKYATFEEFLEKDDTEYRLGDDLMDDNEVRKEAARRVRLRQAQRSGRISHGRIVNALPEKPFEQRLQEKHFSHQDHLVAHAKYFRKLMFEEQTTHRRQAAILAHEAKRYLEAKAIENRVKSAEEIEEELFQLRRATYRTVVKDVDKLWAAVTAEVEASRYREYEEQQQAENKRHLERVLDRTTQMLTRDAEDSMLNSNDVTDEDSAAESDEESENSEDLSESDSDSNSEAEKVDDDADLTVEQLRAKYENIPDVDKSTPDPDTVPSSRPVSTAGDDEESDPETEMDSEFDTDESDEEAEDDSEEEDDGRGLLGLFFSKKELKKAADQEPVHTPNSSHSHGAEMAKVNGESPANLIEELPADQDVDMPDTGVTAAEAETNPEATAGARSNEAPQELAEQSAEVVQEVSEVAKTTTPEAHVNDSVSSAASPHTTITKVSAPESVSSVEPQSESMAVDEPENKTSDIKTPVPSLLRGTLRTYQHEGLDWLATLYANGRSGILADEMGLGKTIQSIAVLAHLAEVHEIWGPHLIVVPTSVMLNWEMEFKKFLPGFKVLTYYGSIEERKAKRRGWLTEDSFNVCITSYQLVLQDQASFKRRQWQYMILDEAHNIKNFRSERWQTMMTFNTQARLLLTGTPLQNNLTELWSLLFFLHYGQETDGEDDAFAGLKEWSEWFKRPVESILEHNKQVLDQEDKEQVAKLHKVIRPFLLRRLKADVEKQMPLKYEHVELCRLSKRQRQLYDGFMSRAQTKETLASGNYLSIINALMQLRKVCNHPDLFETRPINTSFAMQKSVAADFEIRNLLFRRRLTAAAAERVNLDFLQLIPICHENLSHIDYHESTGHHAFHQIKALRDKQYRRIDHQQIWHGEDRVGILESLENVNRQLRHKQLDQLMYQEAYRHHAHPLYGRGLIQKLTCETTYDKLARLSDHKVMTRFWERENPVDSLTLVQSIDSRSRIMEPLVQKYACITPAAVANDMSALAITDAGATALRQSPQANSPDPFHEAQMKLSIAFPDKRLLQYDCGKLQRLDKLLRTLQAGGHRALIFTQMTKVLDILEQFLNIHGHRYLRLDGATKIEQRQLLTERFNNDTRILAFILSSRSGGLGINLTGADTVIFYDLDWNPAMDKQCTDRAHRIGQTRDVHIYRFVSEHTIESNILRKANQKQLLDDVVIQEGDFTTDYLNKVTYRDMLDDDNKQDGDDNDMAGAAMDRVLGNDRTTNTAALEQAEDKEDIAAAKVATREVLNADEGDFEERTTTGGAATEVSSKAHTPGPFGATNAALDEAATDQAQNHVDNYMIRLQRYLLKDVPLAALKDRSKKGKSKNRRRDELRRKR